MNVPPEFTVPLVIVGYDFTTASSVWRSELVLTEEEQNALARRLEAAGMGDGLAVLNTCNRNEWIVSTNTPAWTGEILRAQMLARLKERTKKDDIPEPYIHAGADAVRHILRVAAALESFIVGERQIGCQVTQALTEARRKERASVILNGLGPICGRTSREAARVGVGDPELRGVHDAAIHLLERRFPADESTHIVVLGAGAIGRQLAQSVQARTAWRLTRVNRGIPEPNPLNLRPLSELPEILETADMLAVCTGAFTPVLRPEHLQRVNPAHGLEIVDIGIPVQTDPACRTLPGVNVTDLDGLQDAGIVWPRDALEIRRMEEVVEKYAGEFERFCQERELVNVLKTTQNQHEHFIRRVIPALLDEELPGLSESRKSKLTFRLRGLIREYTNSIFDSIHETAKEKNNGRED